MNASKTRRSREIAFAASACVLAAVAGPVLAHVGAATSADSIATGLLHLFTEPAQLMLVLAFASTFLRQDHEPSTMPLVALVFAFPLCLVLVTFGSPPTMRSFVPAVTVLAALVVVVGRTPGPLLHTILAVVVAYVLANDSIGNTVALDPTSGVGGPELSAPGVGAAAPVVPATSTPAIVDPGIGRRPAPLQLWSLLGLWIGVTMTTAAIALVVMRAGRVWQRIGMRIVAAWIAAGALLYLALALRGLR